MPDHRLTLTIEGFANDDGHVLLSAFLHEVQAFVSVIARADTLASGGKATIRARVVDLKHQSPAVITVELLPRNAAIDTRARVAAAIIETQKIIDDPDAMGDRGRPLLRAMSELTSPVGRQVKSAMLTVGDDHLPLTEELRHKIALALAPEETSFGTIEGRLEAINLHDAANVFYIYPAVGPTRIKGRFPSDQRERAVASVDRNVRVNGTLKYKAKAPFPHEVEVIEFEPLPRDEELPTMGDLYGIAAGATDDLTSEDFVRRVRDGWR